MKVGSWVDLTVAWKDVMKACKWDSETAVQ